MEQSAPTDEGDAPSEARSEEVQLRRALNAAQRAVERFVHKANAHDDHNYRYVGHEQVVEHCAAAMLEQGLDLHITHTEGPHVVEARKGVIWVWTCTAVLTHVDGGTRTYQYSVTTHPGDKAAFIATTGADRTIRLRLMQLAGSNDNPEQHDRRDRDDEAPKGVISTHMQRLFGHALKACETAAELRDWVGALKEQKLAKGAQRDTLYEMYTARCAELELDANAIQSGDPQPPGVQA